MPGPAPRTKTKYADERRLFAANFGNFEEFRESPAQTISSAVVSATGATGSLTIGSPDFSVNPLVKVWISGGSGGTTYTVLFKIQTSGGATLEQEGLLLVISE